MIRVIFAEDHQALIDGVSSFFKDHDEIEIIATALNGEQLLEMVRLMTPDVVITDIRMPIMDGIQATKIIKKEFPNINILAFSMFDQPKAVDQMLKAGASGYILKNSGLKIIREAIKEVSIGKNYFDPNVFANLKKYRIKEKRRVQKKGILSRREKEILHLIANGKKSSEISEKLGITKFTVDTHRKNMTKKLGITSSSDLMKFAIEKKYDF